MSRLIGFSTPKLLRRPWQDFSDKRFIRIYLIDIIYRSILVCSIPPPQAPPVDQLSVVAVDAVSLAIVAFAINVSLAKLFAKKHGYEVDTNQVCQTECL